MIMTLQNNKNIKLYSERSQYKRLSSFCAEVQRRWLKINFQRNAHLEKLENGYFVVILQNHGQLKY